MGQEITQIKKRRKFNEDINTILAALLLVGGLVSAGECGCDVQDAVASGQ